MSRERDRNSHGMSELEEPGRGHHPGSSSTGETETWRGRGWFTVPRVCAVEPVPASPGADGPSRVWARCAGATACRLGFWQPVCEFFK